MVGSSIPVYIGNIGVITLVILVIWILMTLSMIAVMRRVIDRGDLISILPEKSWRTIISGLWSVILDWCVIGFFLYLALRSVTTLAYEFISFDRDFYFLLTLLILLIRPQLRYILTKWEHRIYPIIGMLLYYGIMIRDIGISGIWLEKTLYISEIWRYALGFVILQKIATMVFNSYDVIINKSGGRHILFSTIPYSLVIFAGFCSTYFWQIELTELLQYLMGL